MIKGKTCYLNKKHPTSHLECKIGCRFCSLLIFSVFCGMDGKATFVG